MCSVAGSVFEHIEGGAGDMARFERVIERVLDDEAAARAIDDAHALLHLGDRRRIDDAARLVGQRRVQRDEIGAAEDVVELDLLDADLDRPLRRQERIEGDDLHLEAERPVGDDRADIAAADDAQRLVEELDAHEAVLLPLAGMGRGIGLGDLAGQRHHQRDRVLGRGDGVAEGRVHHDDAARRGGGNVDIVDADAGAADHLEIASPRR